MASLPHYRDALALDLTVLKALLKRNQHSHGRTLYFSRMSMALRAIQRYEIMSISFQPLEAALQKYGKKRQEWSTQTQDPLEDVQKQVESIKDLLESGVSEIVSRIDHAADALFVEVARGFFLPLCVVALGCLARIRILILRNARQMTLDLQRLIMDKHKDVADVTSLVDASFFETTLERFIEPSMQLHQVSTFDTERTLQSLGLGQEKKQESGETSDTAEAMLDESALDNDKTDEAVVSSPGAAAKKLPLADVDDLRESVATFLESKAVVESQPVNTNASPNDELDDSDKNLQFLNQLKSTSSAKRSREEQEPSDKKKKSKKRKKATRKKKKTKDVFDEIFGD